MDVVYYFRELGDQNPLYLSNGHPMKFEYISTSDAWLIMELDAAIQQGIGGVIKITKEQYEEGIKKKTEAKSRNGSQNYRQELQAPNMFNNSMRAKGFQGVRAVAGGINQPQAVRAEDLPDPLQVPDPSQFKMPSVGKIP